MSKTDLIDEKPNGNGSKKISTFYTEDSLYHECLRILAARKKGNWTKERVIHQLSSATPWVEFKQEIDSNPESTSDDKFFAREMRRNELVKCIKKLFNEGYVPAEIARSLKISYTRPGTTATD